MDIDNIKQTALQLFERYSFSKTSVSDIAQACGMGKGTLYLYFKSKEEVLFAISQDRLIILRSKLDSLTFSDRHEQAQAFVFGIIEEFNYLKGLLYAEYINKNTGTLHGLFEKCQPLREWGITNLVDILGKSELIGQARFFLDALLGILMIIVIADKITTEDELKNYLKEQITLLYNTYLRRDL